MAVDKIFVVTMYRYGDKELHSYVLGAWLSERKAKAQAKDEQFARGGNKYIPEILCFNPQLKYAAGVNHPPEPEVVLALEKAVI